MLIVPPVSGTPKPSPPDSTRPGPARLESVDLLRGFVMVLMAVDHTRGFFSNYHDDPLDLDKTTPALFLTRWMTHLCAPVFFFLAGTGAFLWQSRGRSKGELSRFLITRGLWLVVLDVTLMSWFGWKFNFSAHQLYSVVLWAAGWNMVALAGLIWLPIWAMASVGVAMIALHNMLDGIRPESFGYGEGLWRILHAGGNMDVIPGLQLEIIYPLIPWIGVGALGYCFGRILLLEAPQRRKWITLLGVTLTALFLVVRGVNVYGDPVPWSVQKNELFTAFSFVKCHKYPPSLCFLLMTLGPALLLLAAFDRKIPSLLRPLLVFGRAPLFYFLLHVPLIHSLAILVNLFRLGRAGWLYGPQQPGVPPPPESGFGLAGVYFFAMVVVLILYPVCKWFAEYKRQSKAGWLSYL